MRVLLCIVLLIVIPTARAEFQISREECVDRSPALAWNGENYLVTWNSQWLPWGYFIACRLVSQDGEPIDTVFWLWYACWNEPPDVCWSGEKHLVVFENMYSALHGVFVSKEGVAEGAGFLIEDVTHRPQVAWGTNSFLVVWLDAWASTSGIYGRMVSQDGELVDTAFLIAPIPEISWGYSPCITFGSENYLVAWIAEGEIRAARVASSGEILDTSAINITSAPLRQRHPDIQWDGEKYLVVWDDEREGENEWAIYGQFVSEDGALIDSNFCVLKEGKSPSIAWSDTKYLLVAVADSTLWGQFVFPDGGLVDTAFCAAGEWSNNPSVAWGSRHHLLVWNDYNDIWGEIVTPIGINEEKQPRSVVPGLKLYPNPFTNSVRIIGANGLEIYDSSGRLVAEISGSVWNGRDALGREARPGVYFLRSKKSHCTMKAVKIK